MSFSWYKFKYKIKKSDFFILALLLLLLLSRIPGALENFNAEGKIHSPQERIVLDTGALIQYPPAGAAVTIFWATWCAPCKFEMLRLKKSVEAGKLPRGRVFAVSLNEDAETVLSFLQKNPYPFTFLASSKADEVLPVAATPTLVLWKDRRVQSIGTGLSLWGIWRAESLF